MAEESTATFMADYEDPSGYVRHLTFSFYQSDCSVGLFDTKRGQMFLKRITPPEAISMGSLYPGATVTVCSRPMKIVGFADDKTRRLFATTRGAALLLVKPDAYQQMGEILDVVSHSGISVGRLRMVKMTAAEAAHFVQLGATPAGPAASAAHAPHAALAHTAHAAHGHSGHGGHGGHAASAAAGGGGSSSSASAAASSAASLSLTRDNMLCIELAGEDIIARVHELAGPADPADARAAAPRSLRAIFGSSRELNAVHASRDLEAAGRELAFIFERHFPFTAVYAQCCALVIKPHVVAAKMAGRIVDAVLRAGLEVSALRSLIMATGDAADYLEPYKSVVPEFSRWVKELTSGPSVLLEVRGDDCCRRLRELCGPYDPVLAQVLRPGTLRARFGLDTTRNAVFCTDIERDGPLESKFLFAVIAS
jgi:nucleoside diphosphate kinase